MLNFELLLIKSVEFLQSFLYFASRQLSSLSHVSELSKSEFSVFHASNETKEIKREKLKMTTVGLSEISS